MIEIPQILLKAIKASAFESAIDLVTYFNKEIYQKMEKISFVVCLKEEIDKLTDMLVDKLKETINAKINPQETIKRMVQLKSILPDLKDSFQIVEEYIKLRDSLFAVSFNKSLYLLAHKLPTDFSDLASADELK